MRAKIELGLIVTNLATLEKICLLNVLIPSEYSNRSPDDDSVLLPNIIGRSFDVPICVKNVNMPVDSGVEKFVTQLEKNVDK